MLNFVQFSWSWLGRPAKAVLLEDQQDISTMSTQEPVTFLSPEEAREGLAERKSTLPRSAQGRVRMYDLQAKPAHFSVQNIPQMLRYLWSNRVMMNVRVTLSNLFRSIGHSRHLRHGLKNAAGVAALSFPAFLSSNSTGLCPGYI